MRLVKVLSVILMGLSFSSCATIRGVDQFPTQNLSHYLLGPEALPFCGGWIEVWGHVKDDNDVRIFLKAAPQKANWTIWNAHVVVEHPQLPNRPLRLMRFQTLEVDRGQSATASWRLNLSKLPPSAGLEVSFRPFDGCPSREEIRGLVLAPSE